MSYCKEFGKDKVMFVTKEDHAIPSTIKLPPPEPAPGLILTNGDINWNCPCLGGMATGPCGVEFRDAFSCFHYSDAEPKGSDCFDAFKEMQECFSQFPAVYNKASSTDDGADIDDLDMKSFKQEEEAITLGGDNNETVELIEEKAGTEVKKKK